MMWKTHLAFGFLTGLLLIGFFRPENQILFLSLCCLASVLPDIDHPESKVGSKVKIIGKLFEHRGFFHGIFAIFIFSAISYFLFRQLIYAEVVFYGYFSHLILDSITHQGIMPLHPISRFKIKGLIKTGATAEYLIFSALILINIYKTINL